MCKNHKCHYRVIDGVTVHISGNPSTPEDEAAIEKMVRIVRNYSTMRKLEKEHELMTLGYDDPYKQ